MPNVAIKHCNNGILQNIEYGAEKKKYFTKAGNCAKT